MESRASEAARPQTHVGRFRLGKANTCLSAVTLTQALASNRERPPYSDVAACACMLPRPGLCTCAELLLSPTRPTVRICCPTKPCVRRRDERLRMRGELLAQQARRPSLDGSLVQNGRVRSGRVAVPGLADIGHP